MSAVISSGFNLLPYRTRRRREVRRRRLAMFAAACVAGGAAVGGVIAWDAFEHTRLEWQRASLEASLRASDAQAKEHARLVSAQAESRRARQAAPRDRFITLLEALADTPPQRGIALQRVSQRTDEVELAALAPDSASASQWLKRLERLSGVQSVEVVEMKRRADPHPSASAERYEFTALVRYAKASAQSVKGTKS
ncbi:Type IV pilus biogeneis protein PilN [Candidatus Burkholderia humilis]|nr:Type IV pilus biogeneis protein PilN [Candidatus Burkholderia humilis]